MHYLGHALSGCDYTSKVGEKYVSLRASPIDYLKDFTLSSTNEDLEANIDKAQEYVVQVLNKGSTCKTMSQLRYWAY